MFILFLIWSAYRLQGFSLGVPIVTLGTSKFLRGRLTLAMYRDMNIWDCVAHNTSHYIKIAVDIASNARQVET